MISRHQCTRLYRSAAPKIPRPPLYFCQSYLKLWHRVSFVRCLVLQCYGPIFREQWLAYDSCREGGQAQLSNDSTSKDNPRTESLPLSLKPFVYSTIFNVKNSSLDKQLLRSPRDVSKPKGDNAPRPLQYPYSTLSNITSSILWPNLKE